MGLLTEKTLLQDIKVSNINNTNLLDDIKTNTSANGVKNVISFSGLVNDSATIYTVSTGYTFFCEGISISNNGALTSVSGVKIGVTYKSRAVITSTTGSSPNWTSGGCGVLFKALSGEVLAHGNSIGANQYITIWGYETED